jgi:hypothetical protein
VFRSADRRLHEIWWVPGGGLPAHRDLTEFAASPLASDRPVAFTMDDAATQHVVYRAGTGHIHEIRW